eukprot:2454300-Rhodomonas_salina.2
MLAERGRSTAGRLAAQTTPCEDTSGIDVPRTLAPVSRTAAPRPCAVVPAKAVGVSTGIEPTCWDACVVSGFAGRSWVAGFGVNLIAHWLRAAPGTRR